MNDIATAVDALNEALNADPAAFKALLGYRVTCNSALGDHPTVQVGDDNTVGALGLLNGVVEALTGQRIAAHIDEATGAIVKFSEFKPEAIPA